MKQKIANLGSILSRAQAKEIIGGNALDHCTWSGICANPPSIRYEEGEGWPANQAQALADEWCLSHDCCSDVNCPGAGA
ncbi:MAG: hypothetical protein EAZ13_06025 [Sphingobacteriia bacterium]|nr:MAG: hypothetical protein EAZ13_06025 [Sphingobacteriia bacterium]